MRAEMIHREMERERKVSATKERKKEKSIDRVKRERKKKFPDPNFLLRSSPFLRFSKANGGRERGQKTRSSSALVVVSNEVDFIKKKS